MLLESSNGGGCGGTFTVHEAPHRRRPSQYPRGRRNDSWPYRIGCNDTKDFFALTSRMHILRPEQNAACHFPHCLSTPGLREPSPPLTSAAIAASSAFDGAAEIAKPALRREPANTMALAIAGHGPPAAALRAAFGQSTSRFISPARIMPLASHTGPGIRPANASRTPWLPSGLRAWVMVRRLYQQISGKSQTHSRRRALPPGCRM